jgi:uncharacterized integral membrane protein
MLSMTHPSALGDGANAQAEPVAGQDPHVIDAPAPGGESSRGRARRMARRRRLHGYVLLAVALFAFVIALAASNTARVKVNWVFGSSRVSLVWLVLATAILGWLLGLLTNAALHRRTRAPRP